MGQSRALKIHRAPRPRAFLRSKADRNGTHTVIGSHFNLAHSAHNRVKPLVLIERRPIMIPCSQ